MGNIKNVDNNKYQLAVSCGRDELTGKRLRFYKTIKCKNEKEAQKELMRFQIECEKQSTKVKDYTLREYIEKIWEPSLQKKNLSLKTIAGYNVIINKRIIPALGSMRIRKTTPAIIENFLNSLRNEKSSRKCPLSSTTIRHHYIVLNSIFKKAYQLGDVQQNPCNRIDAPTIKSKEAICLDEGDILRLFKALEKEDIKYQALIHVALAGGFRLGECLGLSDNSLNFKDNIIEIKQSAQYLPGKSVFLKTPKTLSSQRFISMPPNVMSMLKQLQHERKLQKIQMGNQWHDTDLLFVGWNGVILHPTSIGHWLKKFIKRHNLPKFTFHSLRHSSASYMISKGLDVKTIANRLGHSNANITMKTYLHSFKKRDVVASEMFDGLYKIPKKANEAK